MAHREVDIDLLRCEAASAILNICEVPEFQSKISKPLLLSLSRMMIVGTAKRFISSFLIFCYMQNMSNIFNFPLYF